MYDPRSGIEDHKKFSDNLILFFETIKWNDLLLFIEESVISRVCFTCFRFISSEVAS